MKLLTLIDKAFFLKKFHPFQSLDLNILLAIADKMTALSFKAEETIFQENDEGNFLYFIAKGQVTIHISSNNQHFLLEKEHFFGEEAVFGHQLRQYRAFAQTESILLTLSRTHLYTVINEYPSIALSFLQNYAAKMTFSAVSS